MNFAPEIKLVGSWPKIALPEFLLIEKMERAFKLGGLKIEDLFLCVPISERSSEGEIFLETKYGKLRTFFVHLLFQMHQHARIIPTALLLNHKKYPYPKINKVSTRVVQTLYGKESNLIIGIEKNQN